MRLKRTNVALAIIIAFTLVGCAGNRAPAQVAGDVAHNGTIVVNSVDAIQKFIASQEAAGTIPRNQAVTAMEAIGRSLKAASTAGTYLDRLVKLTSPSTEGDALVKQIQDALTLVSSEAALALVPVGNEGTRKQLAQLLGLVNQAIGQVNGFILSLQKRS